MSLQHQSPAADRAHWKDRLEWMSAGSLARLVAEGKISSELLTKHFIRRIERLDRHRGVNAVAVRCFDAALQRARDADRALADGRSWGCLHGVPLTVKESLALKGVTTSSALPRLKDFAPAANAVVVQRLLDAGAIIIGKTNLPVNCGDLQSYNAVYGTTCNPWDLERTPGGSSGGSAASLAAGFSPIEIGSDIAGSLRVPAAFCGVASHKPSQGIISMHGHVPPQPFLQINGDLAVVGPMARCCDDLKLLMELLPAAPAAKAVAWSLSLPPAPERLRSLSGLRCAVWADDAECPVDASIRKAVENLGHMLEKNGAPLVDFEARPVGFEESYDCFLPTLLRAQNAGNSKEPFGEHWRRENTREKFRVRWREFFEAGAEDGGGFDVIFMPVCCFLPLKHDHSEPAAARTVRMDNPPRDDADSVEDDGNDPRGYFDALMWQSLPHLPDLPVTVVPIGLCERTGLPIGVQIVAPFLRDMTSIQVGRLVEQHVYKFAPPAQFTQRDGASSASGTAAKL